MEVLGVGEGRVKTSNTGTGRKGEKRLPWQIVIFSTLVRIFTNKAIKNKSKKQSAEKM